MSLTSLTYLIFLLICVCAYYILPKQARQYLLLGFSVFFYGYVMPEQLLIMMVYIWIVFVVGRLIDKCADKAKKTLLVAGIMVSVGFLFFYKYLNFTISLFGGTDKTLSLIVPMGISYITFQCISYMVEVYKGKMPVITNPVSFFVYTLLFMKVTAGPIEEPKSFFDNLYRDNAIEWKGILEALGLIAMGFVKKMVVADALAPYVAMTMDSPEGKDGLSILLAVFMYSLQIYFDFSGYTDIARGSAKLFGISLTENFKHPYMSKSIREFWRRWHISLSDWLKNYIYFPLGGSRVGVFRRYLNIIIVFLVSGIWHGASFNFIIWGLLHGIYQVIEIILEPAMVKVRRVLHIKEEGLLHKTVSGVRTFILVMIAWVFFRAATLGQALAIIKGLFTPWKNIVYVYENSLPDAKLLILVAVAIAFVWIGEMWCKKATKLNIKVFALSVVSVWLVLVAMIFTSGTDTVNSFIYFDF
ncbi:MAG: MBOAT family protein [Lachnospiraceae bacterium]|nr:MBOAT family protein [Lachnospiraceae bacterium]